MEGSPAAPARWRVLKFGGTSVADADRVRAAAAIVAAAGPDGAVPVVVVSAPAGVTNALEALAGAAAAGDPSAPDVTGLEARLKEMAASLEEAGSAGALAQFVETACRDIGRRLEGIAILGECPPRTRDALLAWGELLSARMMRSALVGAFARVCALDAREVIVTDDAFGEAAVQWDATRAQVRERFAAAAAEGAKAVVVPGFIARSAAGDTTTLGRGGSDYSAAILGATLPADRVEIWTDVNGVMSADPALVEDAFSLSHLSYDELMELTHFGARVVHPKAVPPLRERGVPLVIRNTGEPDFPGTWVGPGGSDGGGAVRGVTSIAAAPLLRLEGDAVATDPEATARLFRALAGAGIGAWLISQASSERSICFATSPGDMDAACRVIEEAFRLELVAGLVRPPVVEADSSIVTVVGDGMRETVGISGTVFAELGHEGINVRAIAQGSSERNISLVVSRRDEGRAVRTLHRALFGPDVRRVDVFVVGPGGVGSTLLQLLDEAGPGLRRRGLDLQVVGIANSRKVLLEDGGATGAGWEERLEASTTTHEELRRRVMERRRPTVFVDCTASEDVADWYPDLLSAGVAVVAANKRAFSRSGEEFADLMRRSGEGARLRFEATVGAGLPVLRTLRDLRTAGDRVRRIRACLSGTLAFITSELMEGRPFGAAVQEAVQAGYAEPDPRDDLSGEDVRRKTVILARKAGFRVEPEEIAFEPPVRLTPEVVAAPVAEVIPALAGLDGEVGGLAAAAAGEGRWLAYVAVIQEGEARVSLEAVPPEHPCYGLRGPDNLVSIETAHYPEPLVIRGPGAGRTVTAAGVLTDLIDAAREVCRPTQGLYRPPVRS